MRRSAENVLSSAQQPERIVTVLEITTSLVETRLLSLDRSARGVMIRCQLSIMVTRRHVRRSCPHRDGPDPAQRRVSAR
jgi:hypothetical protein